MTDPPQDPIVIQAGFFYVEGGTEEYYPSVQSRPLIRGIGGSGTVSVNGRAYELRRGHVLFVPWGASLRYRAPESGSMVVQSCHLVPEFQSGGEQITWRVATRPREVAQVGGTRNDAPLHGLEGVLTGYWAMDTPLRDLTNYIAEWFRREPRSEDQARRLAALMIGELQQYFSRETPGRELSQLVQQAIDYINEHIEEPVSTSDLAEHLRCDVSTVTRHFRRELEQTPTTTIHRRKMRKARRLLVTTRLHVAEVARQVGIEDPYYFSRLFRRYTDTTPTEYRERNMFL
jgi:AraC-like DNA-binding protein